MTRKENKSVCAQPLNEQHLLEEGAVRKNWIAWWLLAWSSKGCSSSCFSRDPIFSGVPLLQKFKNDWP